MLTVIKDNVETIVDDGSLAYYLGDQGWGMMPIHRLSEHGPLQDGDTDRGYRAEARFGKLLFEIVGTDRYDLYSKREKLMRLFHPNSSLKLRFDITNLAMETISRQFDVVFADDMDFPSGERKGYSQKVSVVLKAPDPTCYDPAIRLFEFSGGGSSGMVVPIHFGDASGLFFGASAFDYTQPISQDGNADDYPEITIVGPITSPIITNLTYNEKLDFTGLTINAGTTYVINTKYGYKTVIELPNTNRLGNLSSDSDLATFRLRVGYNDINVEGSSITSATKVQIRYYNRYTGV